MGSRPEQACYRPVRSFVKREGRLTSGQHRAIREQLVHYQLPVQQGELDMVAVFGNDNPVILEIGFGNGQLLAQQANHFPGFNFIGIEVHRPGIGHMLRLLHQNGSANVRIANDDAIDILGNRIPRHSLYALWLFFPDPWPKKKHHKRRIVNQRFLSLVRARLLRKGVLHMATDWQHYAEHMQSEVSLCNLFKTMSTTDYPFQRPQTHFEKRGLSKGHQIIDLYYQPR